LDQLDRATVLPTDHRRNRITRRAFPEQQRLALITDPKAHGRIKFDVTTEFDERALNAFENRTGILLNPPGPRTD
jgi:hypothetical protein